MSFEANVVFKTNDGGESWKEAGSVQGITNLVTDGGFINDQLGFISFGSINVMVKPPRPFLFRTSDGGRTWGEVKVPIPPKYQEIFIVAEIPVFDGPQGTLLVNQGPSGDFQGDRVLARFISIDDGVTWNFANLVDPDNRGRLSCLSEGKQKKRPFVFLVVIMIFIYNLNYEKNHD